MYLHTVVFSLPLSGYIGSDTTTTSTSCGWKTKNNYADACDRGFKHEPVEKVFKLSVKLTLLVSALKKRYFACCSCFEIKTGMRFMHIIS